MKPVLMLHSLNRKRWEECSTAENAGRNCRAVNNSKAARSHPSERLHTALRNLKIVGLGLKGALLGTKRARSVCSQANPSAVRKNPALH